MKWAVASGAGGGRKKAEVEELKVGEWAVAGLAGGMNGRGRGMLECAGGERRILLRLQHMLL